MQMRDEHLGGISITPHNDMSRRKHSLAIRLIRFSVLVEVLGCQQILCLILVLKSCILCSLINTTITIQFAVQRRVLIHQLLEGSTHLIAGDLQLLCVRRFNNQLTDCIRAVASDNFLAIYHFANCRRTTLIVDSVKDSHRPLSTSRNFDCLLHRKNRFTLTNFQHDLICLRCSNLRTVIVIQATITDKVTSMRTLVDIQIAKQRASQRRTKALIRNAPTTFRSTACHNRQNLTFLKLHCIHEGIAVCNDIHMQLRIVNATDVRINLIVQTNASILKLIEQIGYGTIIRGLRISRPNDLDQVIASDRSQLSLLQLPFADHTIYFVLISNALSFQFLTIILLFEMQLNTIDTFCCCFHKLRITSLQSDFRSMRQSADLINQALNSSLLEFCIFIGKLCHLSGFSSFCFHLLNLVDLRFSDSYSGLTRTTSLTFYFFCHFIFPP